MPFGAWTTSACRPDGLAFRWRPDWRVEIGDPAPEGYKPRPLKTGYIPPAVHEKWRPLIEAASEKYQLPANLIAGVMTLESGGNEKAGSPAGAMGLMQLLHSTADWLAGRKLTVEEVFDPPTNVDLGTKYLRKLWDDFDGNIVHIASGYNAGYDQKAKKPWCGAPKCRVWDSADKKYVVTGTGKANDWNVRDDCVYSEKANGRASCPAAPNCVSVDYPGKLIALNNGAVAAGLEGIHVTPPPPPPAVSSRSSPFAIASTVAGIAGAILLLGQAAGRERVLPLPFR